ncbi:MAG TPA: aromatic amino acid transport family protein [bacterium]|nr:aromatic amino acid transport family protein [bacterium]
MSFWNKFKSFLYAYAMLTGTIIGVGIFSLPYITSQVGLGIMAAYFIGLGVVALLIHIFWGLVAVKTPGQHRLPGLVRIYLGKIWGRIASVTAIGSLLGAILAYVILGSQFMQTLLSGYFPAGGQGVHVVAYCLLGALLVLAGGKIIARLEVGGVMALILTLAVLVWRSSGHWQGENLWAIKAQPQNFFLPYGMVLFSLWGASAIPEVKDILGRNKKRLNKVIGLSILTALIFYLVFIGCILGVMGQSVDPTALGGLSGVFGQTMGTLLIILGIIAIFTSYITLTLALNKILVYDLKIRPTLALGVVTSVPMILYFLGVNNFITIISFVGSVMLAIDGIFIAAVYWRSSQARGVKSLIMMLLIACLVAGIIYEFYKIL